MLRAAIAFFTRLPVGKAPLPPTFQGVLAWLPVIGLIVGGLVALATGVAALLLPAPLCGLLGCLVWVLVTGGLHLDGVADCGDGLSVETTPARRLDIMKDSRLGTFGGTALFFVLALKSVTLYLLVEACLPDLHTDLPSAFLALAKACCMAGVLSRSLVFLAMRLPSARPEGLGEALHAGLQIRSERLALAAGLVICLLNGWQGLAALGASLVVTFLLLSAARRRLGGVTGDVFGCLIELAECTGRAACCLFLT